MVMKEQCGGTKRWSFLSSDETLGNIVHMQQSSQSFWGYKSVFLKKTILCGLCIVSPYFKYITKDKKSRMHKAYFP